ncbi:hypothetical protein BN1058_02435 [Paraliobacillus sp. PM-2]|uniref:DUF1294 domain-containing protein n=1 Tax=Paraliobacillus sp. PM-2 TaxID=1462524 RepID=UPI00061BF6AD|nr:DUF1294 domain-containing protein [Paraliobacillus sp. PM-2]CQR48090.1 hypothetical protein BN1058_02435 [Paraliobacillus sp. PM-2]
MQWISLIYIIIVNSMSFVMMGIDKRRSKKRKWRIPEKKLWLVAIIGGSIGSIIGMRFFRHKTKHRTFIIGMPMLLILQIIFILFLNRV